MLFSQMYSSNPAHKRLSFIVLVLHNVVWKWSVLDLLGEVVGAFETPWGVGFGATAFLGYLYYDNGFFFAVQLWKDLFCCFEKVIARLCHSDFQCDNGLFLGEVCKRCIWRYFMANTYTESCNKLVSFSFFFFDMTVALIISHHSIIIIRIPRFFSYMLKVAQKHPSIDWTERKVRKLDTEFIRLGAVLDLDPQTLSGFF